MMDENMKNNTQDNGRMENQDDKMLLSDKAYDTIQQLLMEQFQVMTNKDQSPRELFRANVTQYRDYSGMPVDVVTELVEKLEDPYFVLNNFAAGDIKCY